MNDRKWLYMLVLGLTLLVSACGSTPEVGLEPQASYVVPAGEVHWDANDGVCSLSEAVAAANAGTAVHECGGDALADTITLAAGGTYILTDARFNGNLLPAVTGNLTLEGNGATLLRRTTPGGDGLFEVETSGRLTVRNLTVEDDFKVADSGYFGDYYTGVEGAVLYNRGDTRFERVRANGVIGGTSTLYNEGDFELIESSIGRNVSCDGEAGICLWELENHGTAHVSRSLIQGSTNDYGVVHNAGQMSLVNSTVTAGGVLVDNGKGGSLNIVHSTLSGWSPFSYPDPGITVAHSILTGDASDCQWFSKVQSKSYNLVYMKNATCSPTSNSSDIFNLDPKLLPLANNGGPTQTMALASNSPAINAGNPAYWNPFADDQRGRGFPRVTGKVDIGAFETGRMLYVPCGNFRWWGLNVNFRQCFLLPDPCFWNFCTEPPRVEGIPDKPCLECDLDFRLPEDTRLRIDFSVAAFAESPEMFERFAFGLYTPEGKAISRADLTEILGHEERDEPRYTLSLKAEVPAGDYLLRVHVLDEGLVEQMGASPEDFPFTFTFKRLE